MDGHLWTIHSLAPIVYPLSLRPQLSTHTHITPPRCPTLYIRIYVNPTPPPPPHPFHRETTTYPLQIRMKMVAIPLEL